MQEVTVAQIVGAEMGQYLWRNGEHGRYVIAQYLQTSRQLVCTKANQPLIQTPYAARHRHYRVLAANTMLLAYLRKMLRKHNRGLERMVLVRPMVMRSANHAAIVYDITNRNLAHLK